jgi:hemolysin III
MREPFSGLSHLAGGVLAAVGLLALLAAAVSAGSAERGIAFGIYGGSLVGLYAASALYHLLPVSAAATARLRKLDHAMIYVLIAGTYTPVCLLALEGIWRWGLLGIVWTLALGGVALKLRRVGERPWLTVALYLGLGWLAVAGVTVLVEALPAGALFWLAAGGLVYTVGAVVYATKRPDPMPGRFGYHELWHLFVLAGSTCHFWALARYVAPLG